MIWLTMKMWLILALAFLFGIACGWFIFWRKRDEFAYADSNHQDDDQHHNRDDYQSNSDEEPYISREEDDAREEDQDYVTPDREIREYGNVAPKRTKIYERDLDAAHQSPESGPDSLFDMPDVHHGTDLDQVTSTNRHLADDTTTYNGDPEPTLYSSPLRGKADDLKEISGIGPTLERTLNAKGIYYFDQIATWTDDHVTWIERDIDFPGRVRREEWVKQARALASVTGQPTPIETLDQAHSQMTHEVKPNPLPNVEPLSEAKPVPASGQAPLHAPVTPKPEVENSVNPIETTSQAQPAQPVAPKEVYAFEAPPSQADAPDVPMSAFDQVMARKKKAGR